MTSAEDEIADLRRRLAEAEDTLRAIRDGEVDALVVRAEEEDQVFHLVGGGESYRAFMESMDLGAAALDGDKRLLYANAALAGLLRQSSDSLQRHGLLSALGEAAGRVERLLAAAADGKQSAEISLRIGGRAVHLIVTAAPLPMSFSHGFALTFTDVTQRVETAVAEENERIGRAVMASSNEAVVVCDTNGVVTLASPAVMQILDEAPVGKRFEDAFVLTLAPGAGAMQADDLVAVALAGTQLRGIEAGITTDRSVKDVLISAAPLRHLGGASGGCIITMVDLSERKALEKRQTLLMGELDHRMKNMLALVQAISARTLAGADDLKDFRERFNQRIAALAATQNLLSQKAWAGLSLEELVATELAPYVSIQGSRVSLRNLAFDITRDAAVALGLVLHELVTNAVKYGALSGPSGRVTIEAKDQAGGGLEIVWREEDGPKVLPPTRRGFGQTVIARGLGHGPDAGATIEFLPEGVVSRMRLPATSLMPGD